LPGFEQEAEMSKTIIIGGYGSGISKAVAQKFGAEGFSLALVARNADKLGAAVKELEGQGYRAAAFPGDLGDPDAVKQVVAKVRAALGPIAVIEWTAYANTAGDLLTADAAAVRGVLDVAVTGLLAAIQAALPDLKQQKDGAVLVVNGGFGYVDENIDAAAVKFNAMGLSMANAAKHKMVGLLAQRLKPEGVYVGEVMVQGTVKGTGWDDGSATVDAAAVAAKLWDLYRARGAVRAELR
jgi:NADP-dependent 3-hydroxy acid dehydrogenase YdfG